MKLKSYAKINLTLDILRKRDDGYHELETVLQHVELHDEITIHPITENAVIVGCNFTPPMYEGHSLSYMPSKDTMFYVTYW